MKRKVIVGAFIVVFFLGDAFSDSAFAAEASDMNAPWGGSVNLGFSPYLGGVGLELQQSNFGLTLGLPASIGVRYYFDPSGTQWFLGTHVLHYDVEDDETKDGVLYKEVEATWWGAGVGYKWRWAAHWDLTFSLSLVYEKEKYKNATATREEETIWSVPGITIGYAF